jgi:putative ATPase
MQVCLEARVYRSDPFIRVLVLERLSDEEVTKILTKAIQRASQTDTTEAAEPVRETLEGSSQGNGIVTAKSEETPKLDNGLRPISSEVMKSIVNLSTGDARTALSLLELVLTSPSKASDAAIISHLRRSVSSRYDRSGEDRYDMISALHKSIRGSSGDGALYWLAR